MELTLLSLFMGAIVFFLLYLNRCYNYWSKHGIPSPKGTIPLLGHMLPVLTMRESMSGVCNKIYKDFPNASMVGFYKLMRPVLLVREPELVRTVLQSNFASFQQNAMYINRKVDPLLSRSILFNIGEEWNTGRKCLQNAFHGVRIKILFESINGVGKKFVDFLEKKLETGDKYEVELKHLFSKFSAEVMANGGFGIEGQCFEEKGKSLSFRDMGRLVFEPNRCDAVGQSLALFMPELNKLFRIPVVPKEVDSFFRMVIRQVRKVRERETVPREDFFKLIFEREKAEFKKVDDDLLAAFALTFFMEGSDPSSTALSFLGYHLAMFPDIQRKLREEVLSVLSKHNGMLTFESLKELTYMDQVISESHRRWSTVGLVFKLCTQECELIGSDGLRVRVKPGAEVYIPIRALQMDPKYWVDPETFDPERFNNDRKRDIEKFAYIPFGEGPRMCVGIRMTMMQMKVCMASFLKSYSIEISPKTKLPVTLSPYTLLATPIGGFWAYIKRI